jgi:hypothetical protein
MYPILLGRGDGCLFIFKFSFVEDHVCEVFNGVLVNVFHESFDGYFWDF